MCRIRNSGKGDLFHLWGFCYNSFWLFVGNKGVGLTFMISSGVLWPSCGIRCPASTRPRVSGNSGNEVNILRFSTILIALLPVEHVHSLDLF